MAAKFKQATTTQIRNFYSNEICYLNLKFFNTSLSLQFSPYSGKDKNGLSKYDTSNSQMTTMNFEQVFALYQVSKDIINNKIEEVNIAIPCNQAFVRLERKRAQDSTGFDTFLKLEKNGLIIPFKFAKIAENITENGINKTVYLETALGAFMKTLEGYLTGINADRHLNKLTDEYAKLIENSNNNGNNGNNGNDNNNNQNNFNNNRNWNNNGNRNNYRNNRNYNNNYRNNNYNRNNNKPMPNMENMNFDNYQFPNS